MDKNSKRIPMKSNTFILILSFLLLLNFAHFSLCTQTYKEQFEAHIESTYDEDGTIA